MIVYGRMQSKYVLGGFPQQSSFDGSVYSVEHDPDMLAKIYEPENRTDENENRVLAAVREGRNMGEGIPLDAVYLQGRWVGYVFHRSAQPVVPSDEPEPEPKPVRWGPMSTVMLLICLGAGLLLSALLYFVLFDVITAHMDETYVAFNFKGVPMIVCGWILMLVSFFGMRHEVGPEDGGDVAAMIVGILAFIVGAAIGLGLVCLVIYLAYITSVVIAAILPTVLGILAILVVIKMVGADSSDS